MRAILIASDASTSGSDGEECTHGTRCHPSPRKRGRWLLTQTTRPVQTGADRASTGSPRWTSRVVASSTIHWERRGVTRDAHWSVYSPIRLRMTTLSNDLIKKTVEYALWLLWPSDSIVGPQLLWTSERQTMAEAVADYQWTANDWSNIVTISSAALASVLLVLFKSRCSKISLCWGLWSCDRVVQEESDTESQPEPEPQIDRGA